MSGWTVGWRQVEYISASEVAGWTLVGVRLNTPVRHWWLVCGLVGVRLSTSVPQYWLVGRLVGVGLSMTVLA